MKSKIRKALFTAALIASVAVLSGCGASNNQEQEIIVYGSTGSRIWRFSGKFDVEFLENRVRFVDENNVRHTIYFQNGTVIVNEVLAEN